MNECLMDNGRNDTDRVKQKYSKKSCPSNTLSTTNPTGTIFFLISTGTSLGVTRVLCYYSPATKLFQSNFPSLGSVIFSVIFLEMKPRLSR